MVFVKAEMGTETMIDLTPPGRKQDINSCCTVIAGSIFVIDATVLELCFLQQQHTHAFQNKNMEVWL